MHCFGELLILLRSGTFLRAFAAAFASGSASAVIRFMDVDMGFDFLQSWLPDIVVFNVFVVFVSLVAAFRTAHALVRYTEGASLLHQLTACWYDVASTLVAFCRTSEAPEAEIMEFQSTLLRLVSLLSALCLEGLEKSDAHDIAEDGHRFEAIGWDDLSDDFQSNLTRSHCKVENVFQAVHQLVVDSMHCNKTTNCNVLNIAAPILTRSFQELGSGLLIYHEALKLSRVPLPYAYRYVTLLIQLSQACFTPFMMAFATKGIMSSFLFTFAGTYLMWFLNGVADVLDNPFKKGASALEPTTVQEELNIQLHELLIQGSQATPSLKRGVDPTELATAPMIDRVASMKTLHRDMECRFQPPSHAPATTELQRTMSNLSNLVNQSREPGVSSIWSWAGVQGRLSQASGTSSTPPRRSVARPQLRTSRQLPANHSPDKRIKSLDSDGSVSGVRSLSEAIGLEELDIGNGNAEGYPNLGSGDSKVLSQGQSQDYTTLGSEDSMVLSQGQSQEPPLQTLQASAWRVLSTDRLELEQVAAAVASDASG